MKVTLTIIKGPQSGRVLEFGEPRGFVIGRAVDADFQLPGDDLYVSRRHIFLEICPPSCRVRDLGTTGSGSTNPPKVNDHLLAEAAELKDGDVLELGYTQFKVSVQADVTPRTKKCPRCDAQMEFLPGEPEPERCDGCMDRAKIAPKPAPEVEVRCFYCGSDLSRPANSDGRAGELLGAVLYCCKRCLPKQDEHGGSVIGRYAVIRRLGEGGMGTVCQVYEPATARLLALKQMKDLKDSLLIKRFQREMRLMRSIVHANVVRCLETGTDAEGAPFVVTEFVPGGDLDGVTSRLNGRLASSAAIGIILKLLDGVEYLHRQKIIHRDLKPQNVLLLSGASPKGVSTGAENIPKITDFGLAVCYGRAGGTRLTKAGTGMGTLMYMPPEQVKDAGNVREPADLYSVGVILYYLLTGSYTFDFPTPRDILELQRQKPNVKKPQEALRMIMQLNRIRHPFQIILTEEPTPIRNRNGSISPKLAAVVDKSVRKDPQQRFQTAAEFRSALLAAH